VSQTNRFLEFATRKGPSCINWLPTPFPFPRDEVRNTNAEFLLRVALEGKDILDRGDSQLTEFRFTRDDLNIVYRGFLALQRLVLSPENIPENLEATLSSARDSLPNIATYYEDKIAVSETTRDRAEKDLAKVRTEIAALRAAKDHKALLAYYPGFEELLELDKDRPQMSPSAQESGIASLDQARHDKKLVAAFGQEAEFEQAYCPGGGMDGAPAWLGTPEPVRFFEDEICACNNQIHRNGTILTAIQSIVTSLDAAIHGPAPNVVPFVRELHHG
jgi:flagellar motility protein MotE (MotC chaperone)